MKHNRKPNRHNPTDRPVFRSYTTGTVSVDSTGRHGPHTRLSVRNSRPLLRRQRIRRSGLASLRLGGEGGRALDRRVFRNAPDNDTLSHLAENGDN